MQDERDGWESSNLSFDEVMALVDQQLAEGPSESKWISVGPAPAEGFVPGAACTSASYHLGPEDYDDDDYLSEILWLGGFGIT